MTNEQLLNNLFKGVKGKRTAKIVSDLPKLQSERDLQSQVCKWLKIQYPDMIFFSDFAAGIKLTIGQANIRSIQACRGKYLDLTILEPIGNFKGLIIEIKRDKSDLFLVDGITLKSDHVREQYDMILRLRAKGYAADFGVGFDDVAGMVQKYMKGFVEYKGINYRK